VRDFDEHATALRKQHPHVSLVQILRNMPIQENQNFAPKSLIPMAYAGASGAGLSNSGGFHVSYFFKQAPKITGARILQTSVTGFIPLNISFSDTVNFGSVSGMAVHTGATMPEPANQILNVGVFRWFLGNRRTWGGVIVSVG
jgi:hypothetical protein